MKALVIGMAALFAVHDHLLPACSAWSRTWCCSPTSCVLTALLSMLRRGAVAARHRRHHPHRRHGGGRERADLRTHPRGIAQRRHAAGGASRPASRRRSRRSSIPTSPPSSRAWCCSVFGTGADPAASPVVLSLGILTSDVHRAHGLARAAHADVRRQAQDRQAALDRLTDQGHAQWNFSTRRPTSRSWPHARCGTRCQPCLMIVSFASFFTRGLNFAHRLHRWHQRRGEPSRSDANIEQVRDARRGGRLPRAAGADLRLARATSAIRLPSDRRSAVEVTAPQFEKVADERRSAAQISTARGRGPAGGRRTAQRRDHLAGSDAGADRRLHHPALPHLAPVARRHPRRAARPDPGARRVLGHADARSICRWSRPSSRSSATR